MAFNHYDTSSNLVGFNYVSLVMALYNTVFGHDTC
jgi:hypothetical protein